MRVATYTRAASIADALDSARTGDTSFYAGGTTLVDLMKLGVMRPSTLVDINQLALGEIDLLPQALHLGALVRMSDAADDPRVSTHFPALAQALLAGASAQLRNMATLGGNVLQRTRCAYFRDIATACNKREPGSGCAARDGINEQHAVLGTSESCIAVHASDFAVPLVAFDAVLNVAARDGERSISAGEFFLQPGTTPERETALRAGELIVRIDLPRSAAASRSTYVKVRERSSYAFALASCAAGVAFAADGTFSDVRIALGGVGTVPWRARAAEELLRGQAPNRARYAAAARAAFDAARPTRSNTYKIDLGIRAIVRALETVAA